MLITRAHPSISRWTIIEKVLISALKGKKYDVAFHLNLLKSGKSLVNLPLWIIIWA